MCQREGAPSRAGELPRSCLGSEMQRLLWAPHTGLPAHCPRTQASPGLTWPCCGPDGLNSHGDRRTTAGVGHLPLEAGCKLWLTVERGECHRDLREGAITLARSHSHPMSHPTPHTCHIPHTSTPHTCHTPHTSTPHTCHIPRTSTPHTGVTLHIRPHHTSHST